MRVGEEPERGGVPGPMGEDEPDEPGHDCPVQTSGLRQPLREGVETAVDGGGRGRVVPTPLDLGDRGRPPAGPV